MFRNIFWMGSSSAVRLGSNLALFILIARTLGPEEFGHYMFWYTTTLLCSVIANYGLGNMLLKEIAQHPEDVTNTLGQALSLRLFLSAIVLTCAAVAAMLADRPELLLVFLFIHFTDILSETFYSAYRALGFYARETQLATTAAIVQLILVVLAVYTHQTTVVIALAHLTGRVIQLILILPSTKQALGTFPLHSPRSAFKLAIRTKAYALDNLLVNTFGNIDNVVLRFFVGVDAVGIYQSGMRLFQGGLNAIPILSNVFLPAMARHTLCKGKNVRAALALQLVFLAFGAIFGLIMAYFSSSIVTLFGEGYSSLDILLPFFGLLFFIRFFAAGWGVILIAENQQIYRTISTAIHLLFILTLGSYLTYEFHALGWLITLILANIFLAVLYMLRAIREGYAVSAKISTAVAVAGGLLFIPKIL